jgi:type III secretory pathway component EscU
MSARDRSVPASPDRIAKARARGFVPLSTEAVAAAAWIGAALALPRTAALTRERFQARLADALAASSHELRDPGGAAFLAVRDVLACVTPVLVGAALSALVVAGLQTGFAFASRSGSRGGAARPGPGSATVDVLRGLVLLAVGAIATLGALRESDLLGHASAHAFGSALRTAVGWTFAAAASLAVLEVVRARARFVRALRTTPEEARREAREHEGDPAMRAARQRSAREMFEALGSDLPIALLLHDGVRAVVLAWSGRGEDPPRVIGKIAYADAAPWLARAERVVVDAALTGTLTSVSIGAPIPEHAYEPVRAHLQ